MEIMKSFPEMDRIVAIIYEAHAVLLIYVARYEKHERRFIHKFYQKVQFYYSVELLSYFGFWADVYYGLLLMHKDGYVVNISGIKILKEYYL